MEGHKGRSLIGTTYAALKGYLHRNRRIKTTSAFRSYLPKIQKRSVFNEKMLELDDVKKMLLNYADLKEKVVVGTYCYGAIRPILLTQVLIKHCEIELREESAKITKKPMMIQIPCTSDDNPHKRRLGNKAGIDFVTFAKTEVCEWLEEYLNHRIAQGEKLTTDSPLLDLKGNTPQQRKESINYIVKKLYKCIGFKGRPYLLRHLGEIFLDAMNKPKHQKFFMGHKGDISARYQFGHGLTQEAIERFRGYYLIADQKYPILGVSETDKLVIQTKIDTIRSLVQNLDKEQLEAIKRALFEGRLSIEQFNRQLDMLARKGMQDQIRGEIRKIVVEEIKNNQHT